MAKAKKDAIQPWEKQMAEQASVAAAQEDGVMSGQSFSLNGGILSFDGAPVENNQMAVVVVDSLNTNIHYEGAYDPDNTEGPACYAFGRDAKTMKPHELVTNPCAESCEDCENNEWGSADTGKGKACQNTRRLAIISAGSLDKDGEFEAETDKSHFENTEIAYLKLPVTSVKAYAALVKKLASTIHRPPHGVFMKIKVVPTPETRAKFKVVCDALEEVPGKLIPTMMQRHEEAKSLIEYPFQTSDEVPAKKPKAKKGAAKKKAGAKKGTGRKF